MASVQDILPLPKDSEVEGVVKEPQAVPPPLPQSDEPAVVALDVEDDEDGVDELLDPVPAYEEKTTENFEEDDDDDDDEDFEEKDLEFSLPFAEKGEDPFRWDAGEAVKFDDEDDE